MPADAAWWSNDAATGALGTTRANAGSDAVIWRVDHNPLAVAIVARANGAVEASIAALAYPRYTIIRSGRISDNREESRRVERVPCAPWSCRAQLDLIGIHHNLQLLNTSRKKSNRFTV